MAVTIRQLQQPDLDAARRVIRLAFGTLIAVPDPENFRIDTDYATTRWKADPTAAFVAEMDGEIVGSNFATRWGSVGFFGPLTVRPGLWDKGIGQQLMQPILDCFEQWKLTHAGPLHVRPKSETYRFVPEVWLLAALSHGDHVEACANAKKRSDMLELFRSVRS